MANVVELQWLETDKRVYDLFKEMNDSMSKSEDLTGTSDYRLKTTHSAKFPVFGELFQQAFQLRLDLMEDLEYEVKSEFTSLGDMFSSVTGGLNFIGKINNLGTGNAPTILNVFDVPRWDKTLPISFAVSTILYTRTNPYLDVLIPALSLMSQTAIKAQTNESGKVVRYATPGVYMGNLKASLEQGTANIGEQQRSDVSVGGGKLGADDAKSIAKLAGSSGFVQVRVPGLINMGFALMESCKPKWSKQLTQSGVPLWCQLDMRFMGTTPVTSKQLFAELMEGDNDVGSFRTLSTEQPTQGARVFS